MSLIPSWYHFWVLYRSKTYSLNGTSQSKTSFFSWSETVSRSKYSTFESEKSRSNMRPILRLWYLVPGIERISCHDPGVDEEREVVRPTQDGNSQTFCSGFRTPLRFHRDRSLSTTSLGLRKSCLVSSPRPTRGAPLG